MKYIQTYRKKPIEVEAVQISKNSLKEILEWGNGHIKALSNDDGDVFLNVITDSGRHFAYVGDFIVKGIDGNFYAVPYQTFNELYEGVTENFSAKDNDNCIITW